MLKEFKEFIAQGNALDMAIGIILGAAFGVVITSLVNDVLMQVVGAIFGQPSFDNISIHWGKLLDGTKFDTASKAHPGVEKLYEHQIFIGTFITKVILFLIIAFVIFLVVKAINKSKKAKPAAPAGPSEVELLTEIRDALAKR